MSHEILYRFIVFRVEMTFAIHSSSVRCIYSIRQNHVAA